MSKENKLIKKVKRLLKLVGCPRWLHHFGPKTYEFFEHFFALLIKAFCRLSFRRTKKILDLLGFRCPSKSALQYVAKKLDSKFWNTILKFTCGNSYLVAIDSTGFSRTNPSYHYLKRIDGGMPRIPVKLSVAFDTRKKKFCSAKIRVLPAHDSKDAKFLLQKSKPKIAVLDKAYPSEKLYEFGFDNNILLMIPKKINAKRGHFRKKAEKLFRLRTYNRRAIVESGNSSTKRQYGSSVSSKNVRTIRTELYARLTCHNIFYFIFRLSGQSRFNIFLKLLL